MNVEEDVRRQMYRRVWYQAKQAKKSKDYNEEYWQHQLDKYRKNKHYVTPVSKTREYKNQQAKKYYRQHPDRVRMVSAKGSLRRLIQSDKTRMEDLKALYQMLGLKVANLKHGTDETIPTFADIRGRKGRWDKGYARK